MLTVFMTKVKTKIEHLGDSGLGIVESSGRLGVFLFNTLSRLWMYRFPLEETIKLPGGQRSGLTAMMRGLRVSR